jgi:hypothetical protein
MILAGAATTQYVSVPADFGTENIAQKSGFCRADLRKLFSDPLDGAVMLSQCPRSAIASGLRHEPIVREKATYSLEPLNLGCS